ncbi:MAG: UMP kinase, partial [Candidatus ainarchaeum sp.]|nr:UMP kinase [Candidatus ainarchaeum sp.]
MFDLFNEHNPVMNNSTINSNPIDSSNFQSVINYSDQSLNNYSPNSSNFDKSKCFVISVGGSVFIQDVVNSQKIKNFCNLINEYTQNGFKFILVIGGGKTARNYQNVLRENGATNFELDSIGIMATKLNAMLFINGITNSSNQVLENIKDSKLFLEQNKTPIFGGIIEGCTTDADAALIAEYLGVNFVNLSNVNGVYDKDPNQNYDAILFKELSFFDMNFLLKEKEMIPGQNLFIDKHAASILTRSKIKSFFLDGNNLDNFRHFLNGEYFEGTTISDISNQINLDNENKNDYISMIDSSNMKNQIYKEINEILVHRQNENLENNLEKENSRESNPNVTEYDANSFDENDVNAQELNDSNFDNNKPESRDVSFGDIVYKEKLEETKDDDFENLHFKNENNQLKRKSIDPKEIDF